MVSFQCDGCGDVVKKPKLNQHGNRCYATFTCIDCSTTFQGTSYQSHNSCMTEAEKFQKHIYQNKNAPAAATPVKSKPEPKKAAATTTTTTKPMSIVDQLNEKKRKAESSKEEEEKPKSKKSKSSSSLSAWSADELDKDESKNLENALKHVLKGGKSLTLKDVRKKTIELIEEHPKYKKSGKSDLKKSFDKKFSLTLKENSITFA
ncbi:conserved hypothetical protein [Mucor ambiguus]|uniref:Zinc finger C2H2 LYAR-type domain-containing protein n=1 Tax=Mucor ambiguus TaxID=91626 RepID=A0A0C9MF08_9FUNG|nr:conserved hypothetical protein [Mucor ambiguus]